MVKIIPILVHGVRMYVSITIRVVNDYGASVPAVISLCLGFLGRSLPFLFSKTGRISYLRSCKVSRNTFNRWFDDFSFRLLCV